MTYISELAELADDAYAEGEGNSLAGYTYIGNSLSTSPIDGSPVVPTSGFTAHTYYNATTNTLVIAYAGTDPGSLGDLTSDATLASGGIPTQANQAIAYANQEIAAYQAQGNAEFNIVYTGHSLGGYLAQHAHLTIGNGSAVVFNSPGINDNTSINGASDILYVFSNPSQWGVTANIHTQGDFQGDNVLYVMGAGGHSILTLRDALAAGDVQAFTADQLIDFWAEEIRSGNLQPFDLLGLVANGYPNNLVYEAINAADAGCFLTGTLIDMWDGTQKRIEDITLKDVVLSYNDQGKHVPGNVTKIFEHKAKHILDVFGLQITPGHVTLCGDGEFDGRHVPIIDILRDDGAMVRKDGSKVRACTGCDLGSPEDQMIHAVTGTLQKDGSVVINDKGQIRLGTRYITDDGRDMSVVDIIRHSGGTVMDTGLIKATVDGPELPFYWFFSAKLPKPEDYILQRSQVLLGDIYAANEWEGLRPLTPAPMQGEAGISYTGATPDMISAMPPNIPLSMQGTGLEPKMSRKQRRAFAAKMRKGPYKSPVRVN